MTDLTSQHADLLNALDEMQQSVAYAVRKSWLTQAERLIVSQEQEIAKLRPAWNCLVTAADTLNVDPLELAEALGEGRLGALLTVRGKPWESDSQFAEALERLVHLPKRENLNG